MLFDQHFKTLRLFIKLTLDQGLGPVTTWQELAIESTETQEVG